MFFCVDRSVHNTQKERKKILCIRHITVKKSYVSGIFHFLTVLETVHFQDIFRGMKT